MNDALQQFREALAARGIVPPDEIIADGRIHRCDVAGKPGRKSASYLLTWISSRRAVFRIGVTAWVGKTGAPTSPAP